MPDDPLSEHSSRAMVLALEGGRWPEAIREFDAALALGPTGHDAVVLEYFAGSAYAKIVDYDSPDFTSSSSFLRALQLQDSAVIHDAQMGGGYFAEPLHRAMTFEHDLMHMLRAQALANKRGPSEAIEYLNTIIRKLATVPMIACWSELGDQYAKIGEKQHAITSYERVAATPRVVLDDNEQEDRIRGWCRQELAKLKPAPGCFIATAAFSTPNAREVVILRRFRDEALLHSALGAQIVTLYYRLSPPVARFIGRSESLRRIVRTVLRLLASLIERRMAAG